MALDGFVAGPGASLDEPLGKGGSLELVRVAAAPNVTRVKYRTGGKRWDRSS